jgi:hypothetical protein
MDSSTLERDLFGGNRDEDEDGRLDALLEQYRLYVEMADNVSQRRHQSNAFFLTMNLALVTALSRFVTGRGSTVISYIGIVIAATAGIAFAYFWRRLVRSYRQLNSGKFEVIHVLESRLPARLYDAEWSALGRGEDPEQYVPLTHVEENVPLVFVLLYGLIGLLALVQIGLAVWVA